MQVEIDKAFPIEAKTDQAWRFLQDIPGVASCMPGAEITETLDEKNYKGRVKAKLGPATMSFNGDIEIKSLDANSRELHLVGHGQDSKGSSSATMDLTAQVVDGENGHCVLKGVAQVSVTGKAASLGGRMMTQVADQILNQFGKNFANNVMALGQGADADEARDSLAEQPKELNGLAFAWSLLVGLFRSIFGQRKANAG